MTARFRTASTLEVLLGTIVIGHNGFRVVPNEVPILFGPGHLSFRLRKGGVSAMGLTRPSRARTVPIAAAPAGLRIAAGDFVIDPLTRRFWPPAVRPGEGEAIAGNIRVALLALRLVWTFAAFGEEIAYRGYLLTRAAEAGGGSTPARWGAMVLVAVRFGYGHYDKGPAILAQRFIDTFAVTAAFFGWDS